MGLFLVKETASTKSSKTEDHIDPQEVCMPDVGSNQFRQKNGPNPTSPIPLVKC